MYTKWIERKRTKTETKNKNKNLMVVKKVTNVVEVDDLVSMQCGARLNVTCRLKTGCHSFEVYI